MIGTVADGYYYGATKTTTIRFRLPDNVYSSAEKHALTTLSVKPRAMFTDESDNLYFTTLDGTYQFNAGEDKMPYRWRGKALGSQITLRLSAFRLRTTENVSVTHWIDGREIQNLNQVGNNEIRLPVGEQGQRYQVEIRGIGEVTAYTLGSSIVDLVKE